MQFLDLTSIQSQRIFVVGSLQGNYQKLIDILYEQEFSYRDTLVLTGDFIDKNSSKFLDIVHFLKNNDNCFSVKGKQEVEFLKEYTEDKLPDYLKDLLDIEILGFLEKLPVAIMLPENYFIVNKGLEPLKEFSEQYDDVFYSIPHFDIESKYYQYNNVEGKSWFDFSFQPTKICFSDPLLEEVIVEAGYNLKPTLTDLVCLIIVDDSDPIIIS